MDGDLSSAIAGTAFLVVSGQTPRRPATIVALSQLYDSGTAAFLEDAIAHA